ncbi:MAG: GNAT family N-acetyltransferase [Myxococcales bacterium]|nr:GNAT family N-acetyltransferase [Myxococcales bacterium]
MGDPTQQRAAWMASGGDDQLLDLLSSVGTVAVFSDGDSRCLAGIHPDQPDLGTVGDWVGSVDVLRQAEAWLLEQGCTEVRGPMLLCPWFPFRANFGPLDHEPLLLEPTEPGERWVAADYAPCAAFISILADHGPNIDVGMNAAAALASRGWTLQSVDLSAAFDEVVMDVHRILCRAYADGERFTEVPVETFADYYRSVAPKLKGQLSSIARDPSGEAAAFILAVAEPESTERSWFQILSLAVVPEHRHLGVATWLVAATHQAARKAGIDKGVHATVRVDDDRLEDSTWYRGEIIRRYALFRKELA